MVSTTVKLWGVRGSLPTPGPQTVYYGGNTACVSVETEDRILIFDAGSGIHNLGRRLEAQEKDIYLVITHNHWDHIQGFPFFPPLYQKGRRIVMLPYHNGKQSFSALLDQMDGARFPVTADELLSDHESVMEDQMGFLAREGFRVDRIETNHPGGCHGYRVYGDKGSVVYLPDNELDPLGPRTTELDEFSAFCRGATVLIHDAQYVSADMPEKRGWGHSVVDQVLELALAASPEHLILFHHDPERSDPEVARIQETARKKLRDRGSNIACAAAREGMCFQI